MIASPPVYSFLPPSPLKNQVYCFLDSLVLWATLVSCRADILMNFAFIHLNFISYSRFVVPLILKVAIWNLVPSIIFFVSLVSVFVVVVSRPWPWYLPDGFPLIFAAALLFVVVPFGSSCQSSFVCSFSLFCFLMAVVSGFLNPLLLSLSEQLATWFWSPQVLIRVLVFLRVCFDRGWPKVSGSELAINWVWCFVFIKECFFVCDAYCCNCVCPCVCACGWCNQLCLCLCL